MRRTVVISRRHLWPASHLLLIGLAVGGGTILLLLVLALTRQVVVTRYQLWWIVGTVPVGLSLVGHRRLRTWISVALLHAASLAGFVGSLELFWWRVGRPRWTLLAAPELWIAAALGLLGGWMGYAAVRRFGPRVTIDPRRCPRCDYVLAGNVSGACTECGTPISLQRMGIGPADLAVQEFAGQKADAS